MKLTFHCQPQRWSVDGQRKLILTQETTIKNPFEFRAKPLIRVYGSGAGNVYIGDQSVSILANNGYIDLNCETHNAYDASGFCNGYVKSEDFYWDAGSIVMVAPNDATKLIKIGQYRTGDYLIFTFKL